MIKAVIFDMGGVLVRTVDPSKRADWETRLGLAPGDAERIVLNSAMGRQAQQGAITTAELWAWVQTEFGFDNATLAAFRYDFWAGDVLDEELVDLIRYLRINYQTALLSNFMDELQEVITQRHPMADAFDLVVGSAYEKVMKPDAQIYERTLARLRRKPAEAVFIDDAIHNIEGARQVGMTAIHYQAGMDVAAALAALGIQV
ncbi:MAG: HAD family phosphatase [Caldilineaceae bacterium]